MVVYKVLGGVDSRASVCLDGRAVGLRLPDRVAAKEGR